MKKIMFLITTLSLCAAWPLHAEQQKLTAFDASAGDYFGYSVAISGDYAIVGAAGNEPGDPGSAYVFRHNGITWVQQQKLTASDASAGDRFGNSTNSKTFFLPAFKSRGGGVFLFRSCGDGTDCRVDIYF